MTKTVKITLTIIILIIATPMIEVAKQVPVFKLVLLAVIFGAIYAIWKKEKDNDDNDDNMEDDDKHQLDKS